tara:strand:+ start:7523 stop:7795 length:273 start_codon:yes stop_codon:yes gene_type:complete
MAYTPSSLTRLAGGSGLTLWHYSTEDTIADVNTAGYFTGEALNMMRLNDVIVAVTSTAGTPVVTMTYANASSGTAIDVVDGLTVTATDSD